ncbi:TPA: tRNA methyltransferase [Candidatus Woesearchaeota archaeon]|nr:tRNA methyltransferase [Candidatus Woesearchaeota archaeon]
MRTIQKIAVHHKTGKKYILKSLVEDFYTPAGTLKKEDVHKTEVQSSTGDLFTLLDPQFADVAEFFQRGPQVILAKDIGLIIAKTGLSKEWNVVDAGGGSGALCLALAQVCKEVFVYEINPEHYKIVVKNVGICGATNVTTKQEDIYQGITESNVDLITLDLPEPWQVVVHAEKALKTGGFLVAYLPNLTQVKEFVDSLRKTKFTVIETVELLERKWKIEGQIMRPEFQMLGHTGFLTFVRKI